MSSSAYFAQLTPEPWLRLLVLASGTVAALAGVLLIVRLPLTGPWRATVAAAWLGWQGRELVHITRGYIHCARLRVAADGAVDIIAADGSRRAAALLPGSVVAGPFAWLRLRAEDGTRHAELLRGKTLKNKEWRRFLVIWRHLGTVA